jgi:hypothetical protein
MNKGKTAHIGKISVLKISNARDLKNRQTPIVRTIGVFLLSGLNNRKEREENTTQRFLHPNSYQEHKRVLRSLRLNQVYTCSFRTNEINLSETDFSSQN